MDAIRPPSRLPTLSLEAGVSLALKTTTDADVRGLEGRKNRLYSLFKNMGRMLSVSSFPALKASRMAQASSPPGLNQVLWPYLSLHDLLQLRLVDKALERSVRKVIGKHHSEVIVPHLMAREVRMRATALRRRRPAPKEALFALPLGQALLGEVDRLALKHAGPRHPSHRDAAPGMLLSARLFACPKLTKLHLSCDGPLPSFGMLKGIAALHQLRFLSLSGGDFTAYDLAWALANLRQLAALVLCRVRYPKLAEVLTNYPQLTMLRLAHMPHVSMQTIDTLVALPKLESLELVDVDLEDAAVIPLARARTLKHLDLSGNTKLSGSVLAGWLATPRSGPRRLEQFIAKGVPLDDASAKTIERMRRLRRLWAPDSALSPWGVGLLSQAFQLEMLVLRTQYLFPRGHGGPPRHAATALARQDLTPPSALQSYYPLPTAAAASASAREMASDLEGCILAPFFVRIETAGWRQNYPNTFELQASER